jgi:site-specific DNA recombinase
MRFEPRLRAARERLGRLQAAAQAEAEEANRREGLRLVWQGLQEFAERVQNGLTEATWEARRAILRALVQQIEVGKRWVGLPTESPRPPAGALLTQALHEIVTDAAISARTTWALSNSQCAT